MRVIRYLNITFVTALIIFIILYFGSVVWKEAVLLELQSAVGLLMLITIFVLIPIRNLLLPILLIFISIFVVTWTHSPAEVLWNSLREMRAIIPLIILISLVSWIIGHKPYVVALLSKGQKWIRTPASFFTLVSTITHFIASFMTVGGIAFVYQMFRDAKKPFANKDSWDFTLSTAIMQGFTLTVLWTVVHPAFAYGIAGTNAPLFPTMLKGFGLACIGFTISLILFRFQIKRRQISEDITPDLSLQEGEKLEGLVWRFFFWLSLLMAGIFISNQWLEIDILLAVPVVVVLVTTLYFISERAMFDYKRLWKVLIFEGLDKKKKELGVILSAGLLVGTLKETGYGHVLFGHFLAVVELLNINILVGLTLVVIMLGFSGFPPIPAMILLSGILVNIPGGYSPELIALSLLLGVSVTLVIAPVTVPLLLISSLNERSLAENGFRWNILFGVCLLIVGLVYIQVLSIL